MTNKNLEPENVVRIATWSGPRNLSSALMRSFGNRNDSVVSDEPLYAFYLQATGIEHPGRADVIADGLTDWQDVVERLTGSVPEGRPVWYQKHMAHHLLPEVQLDWIHNSEFRHVFLIRDPALVIASLAKILDNIEISQSGLPQQVDLFDRLSVVDGKPPLVVDYADIIRDPARMLRTMCEHIGIEFQSTMLAWEPGPRTTDGNWGKYWYQSLWESTGFSGEVTRGAPVLSRYHGLLERCRELYARLAEHRLE